MKLKRILPVITTLAIMVLIFLFSAQNSADSSESSRGFILQLLDILPFTAHLTAAEKADIIAQWHNIVRKNAHFFIYTLLGFSACAMFLANVKRKKWVFIWALAVALCCIYAATDEFHQTFIPGRSGEVRDILIDTCGGGTGAALMLVIYAIFRKIRKGGKKT